MRLRTGNTDRLQSVFFIKRIREAGAVRRRPVDSLIGELLGLRFGERRTAGRRIAKARTVRGIAGRAVSETTTGAASGKRDGTCSFTQASSLAASGAIPGEAGKTFGSAAGSLSMTVSRVSIVVPCFA